MKIKCPICGFELKDDIDLYIHLESEVHSKAHVANALTKQTFKIHEKIEYYKKMYPNGTIVNEWESLLENKPKINLIGDNPGGKETVG